MSSSKYPFLKHPCPSGSEERFSHSLSCHHSFHIGITPMGSAVANLVSPLKGDDSKKHLAPAFSCLCQSANTECSRSVTITSPFK
ncbi:hypothetical protein GDO78_014864 [Eleutherodactylus coqui]|uniref:Uncharacterized protein n=1 Tax=Eleutherodactylus coqui TaxID=57060 RepID=A0A8J6B7J4_ELECQ|nr:hypothetical protein GDO78_014864 [Eleutherodactylus coqui]